MDEIVIDGCLAKNPADRLTLLQLGRELKRIAGDGVPAQRSARSSQSRLSRFFSRNN